MMRQVQSRFFRYVDYAVVFAILSSLAILFMVFSGVSSNAEKIVQILLPLVFWVGLVLEQVMIWTANRLRKQMEGSGKFRKARGSPGIISLGTNWLGQIADVVFVISLIITIVCLATNFGEKILQYILIFLLVLSFRLHCTLNGKNFRYRKHLAKRGKKLC